MTLQTHKPSGIATWSEDDRPREKLFRLGAEHLLQEVVGHSVGEDVTNI